MVKGRRIHSSPHLGNHQWVNPELKHVTITLKLRQSKKDPPLREGEEGMSHKTEGWGRRRRCPGLTTLSSTLGIPQEYLSKILWGCITLLTTWVRWSWAATTSGGGSYIFTAATFSRIRNARGKHASFLQRRQVLNFLEQNIQDR